MIFPALLTDSPSFLQLELDRYSQLSPKPRIVQLDVLDGEFADELTVEASQIRSLDFRGMQVDIHLMTNEPIGQLEEFWGEAKVRAVIGQIERMSSIEEFLEAVHEGGWEAGLSLDLFTPISALEDVDLTLVEHIQLMNNRAGYQGQPVDERVYDKLRELVQLRLDLGLAFDILVDIGVNDQTFVPLREAGAQGFAVGSYLQGPEAQAHWETLNKLSKG